VAIWKDPGLAGKRPVRQGFCEMDSFTGGVVQTEE
jgi:hypothetical protein